MADAIRTNHERANNLVLASQSVNANNGRFTATLKVPADAPWPKVIVRAIAEFKENTARGTLAIPIGK
jgi:hypothetical protein